MNLSTVVILVIVIGIAALAVRSIYKQKKSGGCCGGCGGNCSACHGDCTTKQKQGQ